MFPPTPPTPEELQTAKNVIESFALKKYGSLVNHPDEDDYDRLVDSPQASTEPLESPNEAQNE